MDEVDDRVLESEDNVDHETENDCDGEDNLNEETAEIRPKINVDDVLRELVERKSKMQSYSQFNLGAAVDVSYHWAHLNYLIHLTDYYDFVLHCRIWMMNIREL